MPSPRSVALIPARQGSKRVAGKNIRPLHGHPLIAYTIAARSRAVSAIVSIVSTDSEEIAKIARHYGAEVPFLRPEAMASDHVARHRVAGVHARGTRKARRDVRLFSLLRPTSPFRIARNDSTGVAVVSGTIGRSIRCVPSRSATNIRARCGSSEDNGCCRSCRSVPRAAVAQHAVSGASRDLRAERQPRDRVDARGSRHAIDRRRNHSAVRDGGVGGLRHQQRARLDDRRALAVVGCGHASRCPSTGLSATLGRISIQWEFERLLITKSRRARSTVRLRSPPARAPSLSKGGLRELRVFVING